MENEKAFVLQNLLNSLKISPPKYKRPTIEKLLPEQENSIETFISSKGEFLFYPYNSESIRDIGWGCAWRCIQSIINTNLMNYSPNLVLTFDNLYNYFGRKETFLNLYRELNSIDINDKRYKILLNNECSPHELESGWTEPLGGSFCLFYFKIASEIFLINDVPESHKLYKELFDKTLKFKEFVDILLGKMNSPVMIDDGIYAMTILDVEEKKDGYIFSIGDPHIKEKCKRRSCFYKVELDKLGNQISNSVDEEQKINMFCKGSYSGVHFINKPWIVLFPK